LRLPTQSASFQSQSKPAERWLHHGPDKEETPPRRQITDHKPKILTKNAYDILSQLSEDEEIQDPHEGLQKNKDQNPIPSYSGPNKEIHADEKGDGDGDTLMQVDAQDLAGIDLEKLEEDLNQKDLQALPEEQLRKVHKVFLDSTAGSTARLGIATESSSGSKKIPRENKRRGQKPVHQLIKEADNLMINSGQIHKLLEGYLHPHPPS
jgi:hypothetical protein